ncbi:MAG TPA: Bax inhibitor-1/YccA family protein [Opitutaceae bacterium]|nr:Bax inhibitor-1/YccA family protein [Opitutaceae bacterium]
MFEANPTIKRLSGSRSLAGGLTYNGVVHRTGVLLLATGVAFVLTWRGLQAGAVSPALGMVGALVGVGLGFFIALTRSCNAFLIGAYALAEGVLLGTVSYYANQRYPGIALQAVSGTLGCFAIVLWLYSMRVLRATPMFVKIVGGAMLGIALLYLVDLVAGLFGHPLAIVNGSSGISIGLSVFIVVIASLQFVIDFAAIEQAIAQGADEREGWYYAFALLIGLVWLYIEILRLLTKLRSRD